MKKSFFLLLVFIPIFFFMFLFNFNGFKSLIIKNIILLNYYIKANEEFKKIISIEIDFVSKKYIIKKNKHLIENMNFVSLTEGKEINEIYLNNYKIKEYSGKKYKLITIRTKINLNISKNYTKIKISKNDIDTIKSKIDKLNDDFYLEIDKLKAKYENKNQKIIKTINSYLKKSNLPFEIKEQIYSVFNDNSNLKNIPDFLSELIYSLEKSKNNQSVYSKDLLFFKKLYNKAFKLDKEGQMNIYNAIYNNIFFFDNILLVTFETETTQNNLLKIF